MPVFTNTKDFTDKMERFCQEYLLDLNATQSAIRAGYSEKTANQQGAQLLAKLGIKRRIKELARLNAATAEITPAMVLSTIKETMERCRQESIPVLTQGKQVTIKDEAGNELPVFRIDSQGVYKGAELLGKYLSLFTDKTELSGPGGQPIQLITSDMSAEEAARAYRELMR